MAPDQLIYISEKALEKYLLSKYQEGNFYPIKDPSQQDDMANIQEETECVQLDKTKIYWLLDEPEEDNKKPPKHKPVKIFNIHVHGIYRWKPKFYFRCQVNGCQYSFYTMKGWNLHHQTHHNTILKCDNCKQKFTTPSALIVHRNAYAPIKFTCKVCGQGFAYYSAL